MGLFRRRQVNLRRLKKMSEMTQQKLNIKK